MCCVLQRGTASHISEGWQNSCDVGRSHCGWHGQRECCRTSARSCEQLLVGLTCSVMRRTGYGSVDDGATVGVCMLLLNRWQCLVCGSAVVAWLIARCKANVFNKNVHFPAGLAARQRGKGCVGRHLLLSVGNDAARVEWGRRGSTKGSVCSKPPPPCDSC